MDELLDPTRTGNLERGDHVFVRFSRKGHGKDYHYVGVLLYLIRQIALNGMFIISENWNLRKWVLGMSSFKEPQNPDIAVTPIGQMILKLGKPDIVKGKLTFRDVFGGVIVH